MGLPILALQAIGVEIPAEFLLTDYPATGDPERLRGFLEWFGVETMVSYDNDRQTFLNESGEPISPKAGDLVLFRIQGVESHCGILTTPSRVLHAWYPNRSVVEHDLQAPWIKRVASFFSCKFYLD